MQDPTRKEANAAMVSPENKSEEEDWQLSDVSRSSENVKRVALAGIMASLSLAATPIASVIPRIPGWDIAFFDPVSFFWIIAFLIGGIWVGMISVAAGTLGLFFFDPSGVGPIFKLLATLPMIVIPWLAVKFQGQEQGGIRLSIPKIFIGVMIIATLARLLIMVPTNLVMVPILYGPIWTAEFIVTYTVILNLSQSLWDSLIPYVVVHLSPIFKRFGMW
ncbi:MAG: hypothetical protein ACXADC_06130 [Candidatus Thorarchaeota archaeon]|jgi:hypothetical protein